VTTSDKWSTKPDGTSTGWGPQMLCGTYHSSYGQVNSTFVMAPFSGSERVWMMASAKVIKQCIDIAAANPGGGSDEDKTAQKKALFETCYESCTFRMGAALYKKGSYNPEIGTTTVPSASDAAIAPPETFEYLFAPFFGAVSVRQINTLRAVNGYAEVAPNFIALLLINFPTVATTLAAGPATFMEFAEDTVLLSAMLSHKDHTTTLLDAVFPLDGGNGSLPLMEYVSKLAGGDSDSVLKCGEMEAEYEVILNATCKSNWPQYCGSEGNPCTCDGPSLVPIPGSLEGEDIQCSSPFVFGYMEMVNTTFTGEEFFASQLALTLKKANGLLDDAPPEIGAFEELVGSVCPHAFLWQETNLGQAKTDFIAKIQSYTTLDELNEEGVGDEACDMIYPAGSGRTLFDELTGRYILAGSADAFHFGAPVVYMPSFMEVYVWKKFKGVFKDWKGGEDEEVVEAATKALVKIKLRYVSQIAEARAESEVLSINGRPMTAADCDDAPEASNLGTMGTIALASDEEGHICDLLAMLVALSNGCAKCLNHGDTTNMPICPSCRTQMAQLFAAINAACGEARCDDNIIGTMLCTSAQSGMNGQTSCGLLDAVAYLVSYLTTDQLYGVSGYYGYYSSTAANMAYKAGFSLGYGASAFNDAGACYSEFESCGRRRLSETGNRRLQLAEYKATEWGGFSVTLPTDVNYENNAVTLLDDVADATGIATTVSVLSRFIADLKSEAGFGATDFACFVGACSWMRNVRWMLFYNVKKVHDAWKDVGVPVAVTCDPDFEESAVRDALKLQLPKGYEGACPEPDHTENSLQASFLNDNWKVGFAQSIWSG